MLGYKVWKYCDPIGAILIAIYIIVNWFMTANGKYEIQHCMTETGFSSLRNMWNSTYGFLTID